MQQQAAPPRSLARCPNPPPGFLPFLAAGVDAEGSQEAAAGVAFTLARVGSLPDWLGAAVSCDPWSAGPIMSMFDSRFASWDRLTGLSLRCGHGNRV